MTKASTATSCCRKGFFFDPVWLCFHLWPHGLGFDPSPGFNSTFPQGFKSTLPPDFESNSFPSLSFLSLCFLAVAYPYIFLYVSFHAHPFLSLPSLSVPSRQPGFQISPVPGFKSTLPQDFKGSDSLEVIQ